MGEILEKKNVTELDAMKEDFERETKESLGGLQDELIIKWIHKYYAQFEVDLLNDTREKSNLREKGRLSMDIMKNWKLRIKSYGETCELDLRTGKIYYEKGGKFTELFMESFSLPKPILSFSSNDFSLKSSDLYWAFGKMNVINLAMSMAKTTGEREFYFKPGGIRGKWHGGVLMVGGEAVISFNGIKKWFGDNISEGQFLYMLNKM